MDQAATSQTLAATSILLILVSVMLSASSQIMLKFGMSTPVVQSALANGGGIPTIRAIARSPAVIAGLLSFGLSAMVWLFVLSRINVSQAYPCVALGILITTLFGHFLLGETIAPLRMAGIAIILTGVIIAGIG